MVLAGRYEIEKVIGRGGMGRVVRAFDRTLGAAVAIKFLRAEYAGERQWAERLAREVRLARQIHHPNVCRVFDFEQADGRVFLVMELATESTLRSEIASGAVKQRPLADRIADARAIAAGLAAIHAAGIIHRDVSPQNVLRMPDGRLVLSDFGLAIDPSETTTSIRGGTVAYMAPEVVGGGSASFAADVWSLGAVLYEAVFGERPRWRDSTRTQMLEPALGRRPTKEERVAIEACRACIAREPGRRPGTAADVEALLLRRRRFWIQFRERRPLLAATVLGVAALVVLAGLVSLPHTFRTRGARQAQPTEPEMIVLAGEPEDWTEKARVIAEVPGRILCMRVLSDARTARFVWGEPHSAEDLDIRTGHRSPSSLEPATYAEGCPDISPDGQRLVYQGHTPDGRPAAFVSTNPHGRAARAEAQTAEPTMSSEPTWLPDHASDDGCARFRREGLLHILQDHRPDRYCRFVRTIKSSSHGCFGAAVAFLAGDGPSSGSGIRTRLSLVGRPVLLFKPSSPLQYP
jgi:hypothetical protein